MICFPDLLIEPALRAGIRVPQNVNAFAYSEYPHFAIFRRMQCGTSIPCWDAIWHNAQVVSMIPEEFVMNVTVKDLLALGWWSFQHQPTAEGCAPQRMENKRRNEG